MTRAAVEDPYWADALEIDFSLNYCIGELMEGFKGTISREKLCTLIQTCVSFLDGWLDKHAQWGDTEKRVSFDIGTAKISFYLTLHQFFGGLISRSLCLFPDLPLTTFIPPNFLNKLFQFPLNFFAVVSQEHAGMWKRNVELARVILILNSSKLYHSGHVQLASALLPHGLFLSTVVHRFELENILLEQDLEVPKYEEESLLVKGQIADHFFAFLLGLALDRSVFGDVEEFIRETIVNLLIGKKVPPGQFSKHLPTVCKEHPNFKEILSSCTNLLPPSNSNPALLEVKKESLVHFTPYALTFYSARHLKAEAIECFTSIKSDNILFR